MPFRDLMLEPDRLNPEILHFDDSASSRHPVLAGVDEPSDSDNGLQWASFSGSTMLSLAVNDERPRAARHVHARLFIHPSTDDAAFARH
jgi:hypothetical protein